jgi:O-antigen ligase
MKLLSSIKNGARAAGPWAAAAAGLAFPISTALEGILIGAAVALLLLSGDYASKLSALKKSAIVMPVVLILVMYALGTLYSTADLKEIWHYLSKGYRILLIPLLMILFQEKRIRDCALGGFQAACVMILLISYGIWLGVVPAGAPFNGTPENPTVFKAHITHSLLMAFSAFLFAVTARFSDNRLIKVVSLIFCFLIAVNVFFLVSSRTGQLALALLICYFLGACRRRRGVCVALLVILVMSLAGVMMQETALRRGLDNLSIEAAEWWHGSKQIEKSAIYRLEVYTITLNIIKERPVFGLGTGGFPKAFTEKVGGADKAEKYNPYNPHNEYLLIAVQFGVVGLCIWLYLFLKQWSVAGRLSSPVNCLMARGLVILILSAGVVSSTLIDHTEGLFYYWVSAIAFAPEITNSSDKEICAQPI